MSETIIEELKKVCCAIPPKGIFFSYEFHEDINHIIDYLGKKYNNIKIPHKITSRIKKIEYSTNNGFDNWYEKRTKFYKEKWEKMSEYTGPFIEKYNFLSDTFKLLDKYSWFVQNSYQPYSNSKDLLKKLDLVSKKIEKSNLKNKKEILKKAQEIYGKNYPDKKWKAVNQSKMDKKEHMKERSLFSLFAEILVFNEFYVKGFKVTILPENKLIKQPDLVAEKDNKKTYIEVKQIRRPFKEDDELRTYCQYSGFFNPKFCESLQKKIKDFICDTNKKFENVKTKQIYKKILVIDYEEGLDTVLSRDIKDRDLPGILGNRFFKTLERIHGMTILPKKYF